jgi:hypothetical protein
MRTVSRFETLTNRHVLLQKRTDRFISDLRRLVQLLEADIEFDEERTGISDPANSNYSDLARKLRARRDNLIATISRLEEPRAADIDNTAKAESSSARKPRTPSLPSTIRKAWRSSI